MKPTPAPAHLSPTMREWFDHVISTYRLEPHHQHLLLLACENLDEAQAARRVLAAEGMTLPTRDGAKRSHPAAAIARDATLAFCRILRELDLDHAAPPAAARPPALSSNR